MVLVHWGRNYRPITALQHRLADTFRDAGAGLVIGHHPHIVQPVTLGKTPVLFSLGNAVLGTPGRFHSGRPPYGLVATFDIDKVGVYGCTLRLVHVDNAHVAYRPVPAHGLQPDAFLRSLLEDPARATFRSDDIVSECSMSSGSFGRR